MPYSDAWLNTSPPGSTAANLIDDEFRKLRLQIDERMASLVVDWKADPVVPLVSSVGPRTTIIPHASFVGATSINAAALYNNNRIINDAPVFAGVSDKIPASSTITLLEWLVDKGFAASIDCQLRSLIFSTANTIVNHSTINQAGAGLSLVVTAPLAIVLDPGRSYYLEISPVGGSAIFYTHAVRITYTLP